MSKKGWVSVYRKIEDDWIWDDKPFARGQAWIDLLLMANHENKKIFFNGEPVEVKRGQRITSIKQLCQRWGWSNNKVKKFLKTLEQDNKIILEIAPRKATTITIVNYSFYQDDASGKAPQMHQGSITEAPQMHINNNDNNDNNDNNNYYVRNSEDKLYLKTFAECGGNCSKYNFYKLRDLEKEYGEEQLIKAIETSADNNKVTTAYIKGILNNWNKKEVVDGYEDLNIIKL
ncbi:MAG: DnaD domain protein [Peptoniphilus harei]|nr:DnaD domain protein [Peptoniphilus harei]